MKKQSLLCSLIIIVTSLVASRPFDFSSRSTEHYTSTGFIENKGQIKGYDGSSHSEIKFLFINENLQLFVRSDGIAYQFTKNYLKKQDSLVQEHNYMGLKTGLTIDKTEIFRMDLHLKNANTRARISSRGKSSDFFNYYTHNVTNIHHYEEITFHDIYPGIDWVLTCKKGAIKYDFIVHPGANPSKIKLFFTNHENLELNVDGSLTLSNRLGKIVEKRPVSFQDGLSLRTEFILQKDTVSFSALSYNKTKPLIIDPSIIWATYYGGISTDISGSCSTDALGNVYLCGYTWSQTNIASGGFQTIYGGNTSGIGGDAYLVKFDPTGARLWATYYGGLSDELGGVCGIDGSGNIYFAGTTRSSTGISSGGFQNTYGGGTNNGQQGGDAFLVKFNSNGLRIWATYYGGSNDEIATTCAVDAAGNVYLGGNTSSTNGISSIGCHQASNGGGIFDCFLVKFNGAGARLWGTYYGGPDLDWETSCCVADNGELYFSGLTRSISNIAAGGFQNTFNGGIADAFLVKFNSAGVRTWGTYYGSSGYESSGSCGVDHSGNVYICGSVESTSGIAFGGFQNTHGGGYYDVMLVKFDSTCQRIWATYYGGTGDDWGAGLAIDTLGNVFVVGSTSSSLNIAFGGSQNSYAGNGNLPGVPGDALLIKFDAGGNRLWATYYGGSGLDAGYGCAIDPSSAVYICGQTESASGIALNGHQNLGGGQDGDGFLAKFCSASNPTFAVNSGTICAGSVFTIVPLGLNNYTYSTGSSTISPIQNSTYTVSATANSSCGTMVLSAAGTVSVYSVPIAVAINNGPICAGDTLRLFGSGGLIYQWSGPNGFVSNYQNPFIPVSSLTNSGVYTLMVAAPNTCTSSTVTMINVSPTPSISIIGDTVVCVGQSTQLNASGANTYTWSTGSNNSVILISPAASAVYTVSGNFTLNQCVGANTIMVKVAECIGLSESNALGSSVSIYPNPFSTIFSLETKLPVDIRLYSASGSFLFEQHLEFGQHLIDFCQFAKGVYFMRISCLGIEETVKLVKTD